VLTGNRNSRLSFSSTGNLFLAAHRDCWYVRRLSQSRIGRQTRRGAGSKCFAFKEPCRDFRPKPGRKRFRERILRKNERKNDRQGCDTSSANEGLAHASPVPVAREGLPCLEVPQELPFLGTGAPFPRAKCRASGVRRLSMRTHVDNDDEPEVLAVVPLPTPRQRSLNARHGGHRPCR
jgi:hypothetical protein